MIISILSPVEPPLYPTRVTCSPLDEGRSEKATDLKSLIGMARALILTMEHSFASMDGLVAPDGTSQHFHGKCCHASTHLQGGCRFQAHIKTNANCEKKDLA